VAFIKAVFGEFKSIYDICKRVDLRQANKKVFESLIKAGAFDCFGKNRRQHLQVLESAIDLGQKKQKLKREGITTVDDLLKDVNGESDDDEYYPDVEEMPENELLKFEKEMLGFYITNHPLSTYAGILDLFSVKTSDLAGYKDETKVTLGGIVKAVKTHITKKGERMAFVTLEDIEGSIDLVVFPRIFREHVKDIVEDKILIVKGKYTCDEEKESILVEEIYEINDAIESLADFLLIKLNMIGFTQERLNKLKSIISRYKGGLPVCLEIDNPTKYKIKMKVGKDFAVKPSLFSFCFFCPRSIADSKTCRCCLLFLPKQSKAPALIRDSKTFLLACLRSTRLHISYILLNSPNTALIKATPQPMLCWHIRLLI